MYSYIGTSILKVLVASIFRGDPHKSHLTWSRPTLRWRQ